MEANVDLLDCKSYFDTVVVQIYCEPRSPGRHMARSFHFPLRAFPFSSVGRAFPSMRLATVVLSVIYAY
jgi:hypothetical protein